MSRSSLFLGFLFLLGGCHQIEPAPPPLHPGDYKSDTRPDSASSTPSALPDKPAQADGPPAGAIVPRASVEEVEPGQEALAKAILAASIPSLAECRANDGGGTIRLRVVSTKTAAKITIDSDSNVNDKVRNCVLAALSTIDVPDTLSQSSPSMRPSAGFTSIFAVNW